MEQECQKEVAAMDEQDQLFCAKCNASMDFFMAECQTMAPRLTKLLKANQKLRQKRDLYKNKSRLLDFDYQEMRAQKEEAEDRFSNLLRLVSERKTDEATGERLSDIRVEDVLVKVTTLEQERLVHLDSIKSMELELRAKSAKFEQLEKESAQLRDLNNLLVNQVKTSRESAEELSAKNEQLSEALDKLGAELTAAKQQACVAAVDLIDFDEVQTKTTTTITHNEIKVVGEALVNDVVSEVKEVTVDERHLKIGHVTMETNADSATASIEVGKELSEKCDEIRRLTETLDSYETQFRELNKQNLAEIERLKESEAALNDRIKALTEDAAGLKERIEALEQENKCLLEGLQFSEETISAFTSRQSELEKANRDHLAKIAEMSSQLDQLNKTASALPAVSDQQHQLTTTRVQELETIVTELTLANGKMVAKICQEVQVQAFEERCWTDQAVQLEADELESKLKATITELEQQLNAQLGKNQELKLTIEGRTMEVTECLASLKSAQDKLEVSRKEKEQLESTVEELKQRSNHSSQEIDRLTTELKSVNEKLGDYELKVQSLTDQLNEAKQQVQPEATKPASEDEPMDEGETPPTAPVEETTPTPEEAEAPVQELDRLKELTASQEAQIGALQLQMAETTQEHEAKIQLLEAEIAGLKSSLQGLREVEESLANELAATKADAESEAELLRAELASLREHAEAQVREQEALASELTASLTALKEQNAGLGSEVDETNKKLQNAEEQARSLADENKCLNDKYDESEQTINKLIIRLTDLEQASNDRLKKLADELAGLQSAKTSEMEAKQQELDEKLEEISRLRARVASLEQDQTHNGSRLSFSTSQFTGKLQLMDSRNDDGDDESMDVEMSSSSPGGQEGSPVKLPSPSPSTTTTTTDHPPVSKNASLVDPPSPQSLLANVTIHGGQDQEDLTKRLENLKTHNEALEAQLKEARESFELEKSARTQRIVELTSRVSALVKLTTTSNQEAHAQARADLEAAFGGKEEEEAIKTSLLQFGESLVQQHQEAESLSQLTIGELRANMAEMTADLEASKLELEAKIGEINALTEKICEIEGRTSELTKSAKESEVALTQRIQELSGQIEQVNQELRHKVEEIGRLNETVSRLEARLSADIDQYKSSNGDLQQQLDTKAGENEQLKAEVNECLANLKSAQEKLEAGKQEHELMATKMAECTEEIVRLTSTNSEHEVKVQTLADQLTTANQVIQELTDKLASQELAVEAKEQELTSKHKELDALKEKLHIIESQLSQTSKEVSDEMARIKELYADSLAQQDELKALNAKMSDEFQALAQHQANLTTALESSKQEHDRLTAELGETCQKLCQAEETVQTLQTDKSELENKIKQIDTDTKYFIENTTESMHAKTARISELEGELEAAKAQVDAERERADECDAELKKMLDDLQVFSRVNEDLEARVAEASRDREQLRAKLDSYEEMKSLELATMRQEYEGVEMKLSSELAELKTKHENLERVRQNLESNLKETQADLSSTRSQMIEYETELNNRQAELASRLEHDKEELIKKACRYERMYMEENDQNTVLQKRIESLKGKMEDRERELEETFARKLEAKSAEIALLEQRSYNLSKQCEAQVNDAAELNAQWMLKLSEEGKKIKEVFDQHKAAELKLSEVEHANQKLRGELSSTRSLLAEVEKKLEAIQAEKSSALSGQEARGQELIDLQHKLCQAASDKEGLFKDIITLRKQYEDHRKEHVENKMALERQVTTLERQLAQAQQQLAQTQQQQQQQQSRTMNESLMLKIDRHIDSNIQAKLDDLLEQRHRHLMEIEHGKKELEQLKAKMAAETERLNKEHQRALKDKQHQHEKALAKQQAEIKKLQETTKEMQESNDYLAQTIDNLNKQIYEMSEKENENNQNQNQHNQTGNNSAASASMSMSLFAPASATKKSLFDTTYSTPGKPVNKHLLLTARDTNKNSSLLEPGSPSTTGGTGLQSDSTTPKTPSSAIKKQNQCAQQ